MKDIRKTIALFKALGGSGGTSDEVVNIIEAAEPTKDMLGSFTQLGKVSFPNVTMLSTQTFYGCTSLTSVDLPMCTSISSQVFHSCTSLITANLPVATKVGSYAFSKCTSLTSVYLPKIASISSNAFNGCTALKVCDLSQVSAVPTLGASAFENTPSDLQILVPAALYSEWIAATNWSTYADKIVAV